MSSHTLDSASRHSQYNKASLQLGCLSQIQREYDEFRELQQDPRLNTEFKQCAELQIDQTSIYLNIGEEHNTNLQEEKVQDLFSIVARLTLRNNIKCEMDGMKVYMCQYCSRKFSKPQQLGGHSQKKHRLERMNNIKQKPL